MAFPRSCAVNANGLFKGQFVWWGAEEGREFLLNAKLERKDCLFTSRSRSSSPLASSRSLFSASLPENWSFLCDHLNKGRPVGFPSELLFSPGRNFSTLIEKTTFTRTKSDGNCEATTWKREFDSPPSISPFVPYDRRRSKEDAKSFHLIQGQKERPGQGLVGQTHSG